MKSLLINIYGHYGIVVMGLPWHKNSKLYKSVAFPIVIHEKCLVTKKELLKVNKFYRVDFYRLLRIYRGFFCLSKDFEIVH